MKGNIVLIGFMGVGKGRTARMLAEKTGKFAVDCDDLIESFTNKKVKEIFAGSGEPHFRKLEKKVAKWLGKKVKDTIISTGGGFYNVPDIRKVGRIVYLHSDFDQILAAIQAHPNAKKKIKKRPLLKDLSKARALFKQRLPLYRDIADIEIKVKGRSIEDIADEIIKRVAKMN
ncbi:MAG TPA: shikimate kinase [Desulfocapsa sulfexigens]|nr:shikimate kinase [Desulfocapsa sulfexigens]